jgi:hypothetical protein
MPENTCQHSLGQEPLVAFAIVRIKIHDSRRWLDSALITYETGHGIIATDPQNIILL